MGEPAVVDASPLIYLARGGCFDLLQMAGPKLVVPDSVQREICIRGPADPTAQAIAAAGWLQVVPDPPIPSGIQAWDLGAGESAVLAWASLHPPTEAIVDDLAARRCAAAIGVAVRGTLGLVLTARRRGIIPAARTILDGLHAVRVDADGHEAIAEVRLATLDEPSPPPPPSGEQIIRWRGTVPAQKWTQFYMKVLTRYAGQPGLKLEVSFEAPVEREQAPGKTAETRAGLKELGLDDNVSSS